ncbi:hypothetical protein LCGC14_0851260 [marine sediment metagenome]|uniref:Uncharacterized protein n=1 Tax=marine sediment metagenome TaxID=412755 RepID=A0A0F9PF14_9ZZZZ
MKDDESLNSLSFIDCVLENSIMLAASVFSFILLNSKKKDFKWGEEGFLSDNLLNRKHIEDLDISPKITNEHVKIRFDTIVDQIENEFKDSLNRTCVSFQVGYKYDWYLYKELEIPHKGSSMIYHCFLQRIYSVLGGFKENLEVIAGFCYNHSYFIDSSELEETLHKPKDKYLWRKYPEGLQLQSSDLF